MPDEEGNQEVISGRSLTRGAMPDEDSNQSGAQFALSANQRTIRPLIS